MPVVDMCAALKLSADGVAECRGFEEAPCSIMGMTCGSRGPGAEVSVRLVPVAGPTWSDFIFRAWHAVWDEQRRQWTPALATLDSYAGCSGGRSVEPAFHITVEIASVENPLWNPWLALKYAGIAAKLRAHEFQHVRVYQAFIPSLIVSMRDQETCAAAFTLAESVLDAAEPIHALLDREYRQAASETRRR